LNLNPGFEEKDRVWHADSTFVESSRANLLHVYQPYPFYLLDPRFSASGGYRWWRTYLGTLLDRFGDKHVARSVLCVEYFPYHSESYKPMPQVIASQAY